MRHSIRLGGLGEYRGIDEYVINADKGDRRWARDGNRYKYIG
jgi:hypothetical protein